MNTTPADPQVQETQSDRKKKHPPKTPTIDVSTPPRTPDTPQVEEYKARRAQVEQTPVEFALYPTREITTPLPQKMPWGEFKAWLLKFEASPCTLQSCAGKDCVHKRVSTIPSNPMCWSPVTIIGTRKNVNVVSVNLLVLDLDHLTDEERGKAIQKLGRWEGAVHTTHNNRDGDAALRAVFLLSRPVPGNEWERFWLGAVKFFELPSYDEKCKDPSRMFYRPSHPVDAPHDACTLEAAPLNVDEIWALSPAMPPQGRQAVVYKPPLEGSEQWNRRQRYADAVLGGVIKDMNNAVEGERNNTLHWAWFRCAQFRDVLNRERVRIELKQAASTLWPDMSEAEINQVLR